MRRVASLCGLTLMVSTLLGAQACNRTSLHKSFGQRYRDINVAQNSARQARDGTVRGVEAQAILQTYTAGFVDQNGAGAGQPAIGASVKTAGVSPLH